ncbi:unnamed protein product, partial [Sphacelaria rigidula]
ARPKASGVKSAVEERLLQIVARSAGELLISTRTPGTRVIEVAMAVVRLKEAKIGYRNDSEASIPTGSPGRRTAGQTEKDATSLLLMWPWVLNARATLAKGMAGGGELEQAVRRFLWRPPGVGLQPSPLGKQRLECL